MIASYDIFLRRRRRSAVSQRITVDATIVSSIYTEGNNYFHFLALATKRISENNHETLRVEFCHSICKIL